MRGGRGDGKKFVARAKCRKFQGRNQDFGILPVARSNVLEDFVHIQIVVPLAELFECLRELKSATAAAADVIAAEQCALRARIRFQHFLHRVAGANR